MQTYYLIALLAWVVDSRTTSCQPWNSVKSVLYFCPSPSARIPASGDWFSTLDDAQARFRFLRNRFVYHLGFRLHADNVAAYPPNTYVELKLFAKSRPINAEKIIEKERLHVWLN